MTTIERTGLEADIDLLEDRIQLLVDELAAMNKRLWELTTEDNRRQALFLIQCTSE
jgi:hypothetical protein